MCSGSKAGSYLRLIDFVYHSTLGFRVITKRKQQVEDKHIKSEEERDEEHGDAAHPITSKKNPRVAAPHTGVPR